ncbi:MAG: hypothetical protein NT136_01940, partial [Candidatus Moranbacteria bacterium]|nr:hypothetical protein [Candidatus Moranbacteria bacterium]
MATKNKILILITTIATIYGVVALGFNFTVAQEPRSIDVSAYIVNSQNEAVPNGEYDVRFAFYTIDREISDPYPSDTDAGRKIWEETQKVYVHDGILNAYLGTVVPFPESITFHGSTLSNYYLGIRIGTDSEMVPRKRVGSVPSAINSYFLRGATLGTREGDIIQLGKGGKINIKQLPT